MKAICSQILSYNTLRSTAYGLKNNIQNYIFIILSVRFDVNRNRDLKMLSVTSFRFSIDKILIKG